jgi:DHA1 family bicyclomycin/chloramphenicol resistance-like MFS transporter
MIHFPRWALIALITAMTTISSASMAQFLPSLPSVADDFATTPATAQLTISLFMLSYAISQLVWGPLSDRYGRRPMLILGLALYVATSLACALATSIEALIAFRVVQAGAAGCPPVIARAVVRDLFELKDAARVMAYISASFSVAPVVGPLLGAVLEEHFGWRSNFLFMAVFGVLITVAVLSALTETRRPGRAASLNPLTLAASYGALLASRIFIGYTLAICFAFGCTMVFNSVAPFYFIETHRMTPPEFAAVYGAVTIGYGVSSYIAARVTPRLGLERTILMGGVISLAGAVALTWTAFFGASTVIEVCLGMVVVGLGSGFVFANAVAGAIAPYPEKAGAASGLSGSLQMTAAALAGALAIQAYDGTATALAAPVLLLVASMIGSYWALVLRRRAART